MPICKQPSKGPVFQRFLGWAKDRWCTSSLQKSVPPFPCGSTILLALLKLRCYIFKGLKAQSLVLWGAQRYVTSKKDFMAKDNSLWRYQELSVYYKCGKTMSCWVANLSVWQKVMASSSSWLNTCLFYSLFCSRDCLALCRSSCGKQLLLPYCLTGSARTHLVSRFLGVFQWEMQMSFITVVVWFPLHTVKGTVPWSPWGKIVQIHQDFVTIR